MYNNVVSVAEVWRHTVVDCSDLPTNMNSSNGTDVDRKRDEFLRKYSSNFRPDSTDGVSEVSDTNWLRESCSSMVLDNRRRLGQPETDG